MYLSVRKYDCLDTAIAREYKRFSLLLTARDVSPGGTSGPKRQKFHTDDVRSVLFSTFFGVLP